MSNSPMVAYTKISPNRTPNRTHAIDTVTIHCVVGQCTVEALGAEFAKPSKRASSNYGVGYDGRIGLYVEEKDRSWCSSNSANDDRAVTIEVASDTKEPYAVTEKAYAALIDLLTDVCKRNGIPKLVWSTSKDDRVNHRNGCNMTVHRDYANKPCPGTYLYERHGEIAAEVNRRLENQEEDMTQEKFNEMFQKAMETYREKLQDNDAGNYSAEARKWAVENGIFNGAGYLPDGTPNYMWQDFITREQAATILYRFAQAHGLA